MGVNMFSCEQESKTLEFPKKLKGTTTIGIAFRDFVVLGADRRATSGYYIASRYAQKILVIDRHVAATIAGVVGDAQQLVERLKLEARLYESSTGMPISVAALANVVSNILFGYRPFLAVQMLLGGVDSSGASLYSIDWLGTVTKEKYTATGSGYSFAISLVESQYSEDLSKDEALKLAVRAIRAATQRDPGSGEGVDVALISSEGIKIMKGEDII